MVFSKVPAKPDQDVEYAPVRHEGRRVPGRRRREPASRTGRPYPEPAPEAAIAPPGAEADVGDIFAKLAAYKKK